jgi:hypothetical protein
MDAPSMRGVALTPGPSPGGRGERGEDRVDRKELKVLRKRAAISRAAAARRAATG